MTRIRVVIVNYKSARHTLRAVASLLAERRDLPDLDVVVVENDSGDAEALRAGLGIDAYQGWVRLVISPRNGGFAYGNNFAIREALAEAHPPDHFLLLNPDTDVQPGALKHLSSFLQSNSAVGIVGAKLLNEDGSDWGIAFRFPSIWGELDGGLRFGPVSRLLKNHVVARKMENEPSRVDWLAGAAMLVRREVFEQVGLMDEAYFLYYEETDFCLAAQRAGWQTWYVPTARVMHIAGQSTGVTVRDQARKRRLPAYWFESRRRFFAKNYGRLYAAGADLAYGIGAALFALRRLVDRKVEADAEHLLMDLIRHSVISPANWRIAPPRTR